jgi:hypothetical protein
MDFFYSGGNDTQQQNSNTDSQGVQITERGGEHFRGASTISEEEKARILTAIGANQGNDKHQ